MPFRTRKPFLRLKSGEKFAAKASLYGFWRGGRRAASAFKLLAKAARSIQTARKSRKVFGGAAWNPRTPPLGRETEKKQADISSACFCRYGRPGPFAAASAAQKDKDKSGKRAVWPIKRRARPFCNFEALRDSRDDGFRHVHEGSRRGKRSLRLEDCKKIAFCGHCLLLFCKRECIL